MLSPCQDIQQVLQLTFSRQSKIIRVEPNALGDLTPYISHLDCVLQLLFRNVPQIVPLLVCRIPTRIVVAQLHAMVLPLVFEAEPCLTPTKVDSNRVM
jgi:hypothetical protein